MPDARFFEHPGPVSLTDLLRASGLDAAVRDVEIDKAAPLVAADERSVSFFSDRRYLADLQATRAGAVFLHPAFADKAPAGAVAIVTREPQAAWSRAAERLHPPRLLGAQDGRVHPGARLEEGVTLAPGVVVGDGVQIGSGTTVGANTLIGPGVAVGRGCRIGANVSIGFALIGDRVKISSGVVIGEAGFGVAGSSVGAVDVPQLGRVIIQDGVTIGSNSCIDRGAWDDTVIGENAKLDNMVQIAHGVRIGRSCMIAAHVGISGSTTVGDGTMFGGQAGVADHLKIGSGARIAGRAGLMRDVPDGETWAGFPAKPIREWLRESAWLAKQAQSRTGTKTDD
ncbi:MAG TPA: UDP-3-O-(3-hydroxymyristoyl)glucosamine N-acyltransferase [Caulobacteraceae bacterium]|nr:UDP-3-O-(3-hydroxymyristoyl)glucosamine N-acyltransferase [Caulobacteraceae bacterium]